MNAIQKFIEAEHKYLDLNEIDYKEYEQMVEPLRDVECVVRCKDCKWGEPTKNCYGEDRIICGNDDTYIDRYITVPADWFCADGEPKDGDGDAD